MLGCGRALGRRCLGWGRAWWCWSRRAEGGPRGRHIFGLPFSGEGVEGGGEAVIRCTAWCL